MTKNKQEVKKFLEIIMRIQFSDASGRLGTC